MGDAAVVAHIVARRRQATRQSGQGRLRKDFRVRGQGDPFLGGSHAPVDLPAPHAKLPGKGHEAVEGPVLRFASASGMNDHVQGRIDGGKRKAKRRGRLEAEALKVILGRVAVPARGRKPRERAHVVRAAGLDGLFQRAVVVAHPDYCRVESREKRPDGFGRDGEKRIKTGRVHVVDALHEPGVERQRQAAGPSEQFNRGIARKPLD